MLNYNCSQKAKQLKEQLNLKVLKTEQISIKAYRSSGTQNSETGTQMWDQGSKTLTWNPGPGIHRRDLGPGTGDLYLEIYTWDPICETLFMEQIRDTNVRQSILFIRVRCF